MAPHLQDGPLRFHPLAFLEDGGEVVVGRSDIDSYGVFPVDGAALVRELAAGRAPGDAADWYADTYGERIDMADFVATLHELQLVRSEQRARGRDDRPRSRAAARPRAVLRAGLGPVRRRCSPPPCSCACSTARWLPRTGNVFFTGSLVHRGRRGVRGAARADPVARGVPRAGRPPARHPQPHPDLAAPVLRRDRDEPRRARGRRAPAALPADPRRAAGRRAGRRGPDGARVPDARLARRERPLPRARVHHAAADGVAVLPVPAHRHLPPDRDRDGLRGPRHRGAGADRQPRQRAARAPTTACATSRRSARATSGTRAGTRRCWWSATRGC